MSYNIDDINYIGDGRLSVTPEKLVELEHEVDFESILGDEVEQ